MTATRADVEAFLANTAFSGYVSVPLPHGLRVPGVDRTARVDRILGQVGPLAGRSLLDVGTYYGLLPLEALARGAKRAVGLEPDPERFAVARRIAELHGNRHQIIQATAETYQSDTAFDVVLFLNVLHHVLDPVAAMRAVAKLSSDIVVVEFCLADDPLYIQDLAGGEGRPSIANRLLARVRSMQLRIAGAGLPLMAVGNRAYHRTFFFSQGAFHNLFVVHHSIFSSVRFTPAEGSARRIIAVCHVDVARE
jgi:SAM-dependent methyltransferase